MTEEKKPTETKRLSDAYHNRPDVIMDEAFAMFNQTEDSKAEKKRLAKHFRR